MHVALHIRFAFRTPPKWAARMITTSLATTWGGMQTNFAVDQVDFLIVILLQIDDAILSGRT